jgi:hypothetical protein
MQTESINWLAAGALPECNAELKHKANDMDFDLKKVLDAVGPNAGLVFASWMFMQLLQGRYSNAYDRYRAPIDNFRQGAEGMRKDTIRDEIALYRTRVDYMRRATDLGLYAAILLIGTLIIAVLDAMFGSPTIFKYLGTATTLAGLAAIIWSAALVVRENHLIKMPLDRELDDVPELRDIGSTPRSTEMKSPFGRTGK